MKAHDIHDFVQSSQREIGEEYARIRKRAKEDPGTAGDQGEENWRKIFGCWLPSYFQVVTKGRILTESGYASRQVDVLVLMPSYPKILLDKKLYLAGGVAAAFECKTTLKADHISSALKTCAELKRNLPKRQGSPYKELHSTIIYGFLAHSHSWKQDKTRALCNIEKALWGADFGYVQHPVQCIDFICVADLATWTLAKMTCVNPRRFPSTILPADDPRLADLAKLTTEIHGREGKAGTAYVRHAIGQERQEDCFSPIGQLLSGLYSELAWSFPDMRNLEEYFRKVRVAGSGSGHQRLWPISIYSEKIRGRIYNGDLSNGVPFDEWGIGF